MSRSAYHRQVGNKPPRNCLGRLVCVRCHSWGWGLGLMAFSLKAPVEAAGNYDDFILLILTLMVKRLLSPFKASDSYVLVTQYIKGEIRCLPRENNKSWVRWQQLIYLASKSQRGVAELWLLLGQNQLTGGISAQQKENRCWTASTANGTAGGGVGNPAWGMLYRPTPVRIR